MISSLLATCVVTVDWAGSTLSVDSGSFLCMRSFLSSILSVLSRRFNSSYSVSERTSSSRLLARRTADGAVKVAKTTMIPRLGSIFIHHSYSGQRTPLLPVSNTLFVCTSPRKPRHPIRFCRLRILFHPSSPILFCSLAIRLSHSPSQVQSQPRRAFVAFDELAARAVGCPRRMAGHDVAAMKDRDRIREPGHGAVLESWKESHGSHTHKTPRRAVRGPASFYQESGTTRWCGRDGASNVASGPG
jgi:hypothetical protein